MNEWIWGNAKMNGAYSRYSSFIDNSDKLIFTKERFNTYPDVWITDENLSEFNQISDASWSNNEACFSQNYEQGLLVGIKATPTSTCWDNSASGYFIPPYTNEQAQPINVSFIDGSTTSYDEWGLASTNLSDSSKPRFISNLLLVADFPSSTKKIST